MISEHFSRDELECPCCGVCAVTPALVNALEALRERAGQAVHVNSGYRCPAHNAAVGGEPHSFHMRGMAADVTIDELYGSQIRELARKVFAFGGIGAAPRWAHVDTRPHTNLITTWNYDAARTVVQVQQVEP